MNKLLYLPICWFMAMPVWAKDIIQVAQKVERNGTKFAIQLAVIGMLLASLGFVFGRQDANEKLMKAIIGTILACCAASIVSTIKAWV